MKAGDCSFHNGLTAHAAGPNMTTEDRRAFAIIYMPDGASFNGNRNVLPEALSQSLSIGEPLNDASQNPIIFQR
jgi:ectoine hydroxylase-related dioxygenase (phytanoyl-CoA dioxygenase family)